MIQTRLLVPPQVAGAFYHCTGRVVDRQIQFDEEEKDKFIELMRDYEKFCGVQVVAYCVMSDHYHLLLSVFDPPETVPTDKELIARLRRLPAGSRVEEYEEALAAFRKQGDEEGAEKLRRQILERMFNLSGFMQQFTRRFTAWFNPRFERRGTLWERSFKSVVVEGAGPMLSTVAAYIDLNPVRARLVDDPKDYRWCGYAEALAGGSKAREGTRRIVSGTLETHVSVNDSLAAYRECLFGVEDGTGFGGRPGRPLLTRQEIRQVIDLGIRLPLVDFLRCRVRYFTDGMALGRKRFVEEVFNAARDRFDPRRETGARQFNFVDHPDLWSMRALQYRVLGRY